MPGFFLAYLTVTGVAANGIKVGNRRAKRSHIGAQNGPTWVQGFTI